jgi:hypothetical protein
MTEPIGDLLAEKSPRGGKETVDVVRVIGIWGSVRSRMSAAECIDQEFVGQEQPQSRSGVSSEE